ncbi:hypothetical protein TRFO_32884 [Tritrichomonas foetus]|uniref:Uncharacterized protein n=1 Tax=Tritrichomonas foetus TaxID=1144522 RepID=A0A1J4JNX9_9EUKA|nr:hypothetical protein TRFO_32884 [Tritrichomonas foetus]|eukprot:OHT00434.1 hypothetical protein TRFO_32884 [Tritrichomonas foetus]
MPYPLEVHLIGLNNFPPLTPSSASLLEDKFTSFNYTTISNQKFRVVGDDAKKVKDLNVYWGGINFTDNLTIENITLIETRLNMSQGNVSTKHFTVDLPSLTALPTNVNGTDKFTFLITEEPSNMEILLNQTEINFPGINDTTITPSHLTKNTFEIETRIKNITMKIKDQATSFYNPLTLLFGTNDSVEINFDGANWTNIANGTSLQILASNYSNVKIVNKPSNLTIIFLNNTVDDEMMNTDNITSAPFDTDGNNSSTNDNQNNSENTDSSQHTDNSQNIDSSQDSENSENNENNENNNNSNKKKINSGAIAGIVIGVLVGVAGVVMGIIYFVYVKRNKQITSNAGNNLNDN